MNKKIHYVYKTVNMINEKFYIGKHSAYQFDPCYFGSGTAIRAALKKYGKESFKVSLVKKFLNEDEAYTYEKNLIKNYLNDNKCYNLVAGGKGFTQLSSKHASNLAKKSNWLDLLTPEEKIERLEKLQNAGKRGALVNRENKSGMFAMTYEQRKEWSKKNNSNRLWITNGIEDKRIKKKILFLMDIISEEVSICLFKESVFIVGLMAKVIYFLNINQMIISKKV
jgi:hypothetical protein